MIKTRQATSGRSLAAYRNVILPVNGYPPNERVIPVAQVMADLLSAEITLASMLFDDKLEPERIHLLRLLGSRLRSKATSVSVSEGRDPSAYVLDLINDSDSLVVLAGGTTVLGIPGSVTTDVLRFAANPFVIVGPNIDITWRGPIQRIIVPLDGSAAAEAALTAAVPWAAFTDATLDLIQVVDPNDSDSTTPGTSDAADGGYLEGLAGRIRGEHGIRVNVEVLHASKSKRVDAISAYVGKSTNRIMCMASNGFHRSGSMVAGVSLRIIHHTQVPAIIVRS